MCTPSYSRRFGIYILHVSDPCQLAVYPKQDIEGPAPAAQPPNIIAAIYAADFHTSADETIPCPFWTMV